MGDDFTATATDWVTAYMVLYAHCEKLSSYMVDDGECGARAVSLGRWGHSDFHIFIFVDEDLKKFIYYYQI